ncbi:hypothetical protein ACMFMG_007093 [Clarireedia jacksonii]
MGTQWAGQEVENPAHGAPRRSLRRSDKSGHQDDEGGEWKEVKATRGTSRSRSASHRRGGGRGAPATGSHVTLPVRSTALNQAPEPTGQELIFNYKHIYFIFNRIPDPQKQKETEEGFKAFVKEFRNSDGTFSGNYLNPDFKPRFCLVSGQGPHRTNVQSSDGSYNATADNRLHLTGTFMDNNGVKLTIPVGQDIHIVLDNKTKKIIKHSKKEPNHSWGLNTDMQIREANRQYIQKNIELGRMVPNKDKTPSPQQQTVQPATNLVESKAPVTSAWGAPAQGPPPGATIVSEGPDDTDTYYWTYDDGNSYRKNSRGVLVQYDPKISGNPKGKGTARNAPEPQLKYEGTDDTGTKYFEYDNGHTYRWDEEPNRLVEYTPQFVRGDVPEMKSKRREEPSKSEKKSRSSAPTETKKHSSRDTHSSTKPSSASKPKTKTIDSAPEEVKGSNNKRYRKTGHGSSARIEYLSSDGKTWKKASREDWDKYCKKK